ncbi:hypothetical protein CYMTET_32720, partial [Cymbomonas tetramitiformis]
ALCVMTALARHHPACLHYCTEACIPSSSHSQDTRYGGPKTTIVGGALHVEDDGRVRCPLPEGGPAEGAWRQRRPWPGMSPRIRFESDSEHCGTSGATSGASRISGDDWAYRWQELAGHCHHGGRSNHENLLTALLRLVEGGNGQVMDASIAAEVLALLAVVAAGMRPVRRRAGLLHLLDTVLLEPLLVLPEKLVPELDIALAPLLRLMPLLLQCSQARDWLASPRGRRGSAGLVRTAARTRTLVCGSSTECIPVPAAIRQAAGRVLHVAALVAPAVLCDALHASHGIATLLAAAETDLQPPSMSADTLATEGRGQAEEWRACVAAATESLSVLKVLLHTSDSLAGTMRQLTESPAEVRLCYRVVRRTQDAAFEAEHGIVQLGKSLQKTIEAIL